MVADFERFDLSFMLVLSSLVTAQVNISVTIPLWEASSFGSGCYATYWLVKERSFMCVCIHVCSKSSGLQGVRVWQESGLKRVPFMSRALPQRSHACFIPYKPPRGFFHFILCPPWHQRITLAPQIWPQPHSVDMHSPLSPGLLDQLLAALQRLQLSPIVISRDTPISTQGCIHEHPSACRGGPKRHMTPYQLSASRLRKLLKPLGWRPFWLLITPRSS